MRYFKLIYYPKEKGKFSIWVLRPDGKERCLYNNNSDIFDENQMLWHYPKDIDQETLIEIYEERTYNIKELSESDAFMEML